ncbi:Fc.00g002380.m01.CDS01 [Cosmosporella sp. VM-42]
MATQASTTLQQWYTSSDNDEECLKPAQEAFLEAISTFNAEKAKNPKKKAGLQHGKLEDVEDSVKEAQRRYETHRKHGKLRDGLRRFAQVIHHYGKIMEVFVSHHPEYVALAWGTMNLVFVTFLNHEATISTLAEGLCQVAAALPRTELSLILYPTARMKRAVAQLYAHIIKFLLRAKLWYEEHWLKHVWHSISRPVELRFTGLISDIESLSAAIDNLAMSGSHAEQREMHQKVDIGNMELIALRGEVKEARELIKSLTSLMSSSFINTNNLITDTQAINIIGSLPDMPQSDPKVPFQYNLGMRNRRLKQGLAPITYPTITPSLRSWSYRLGSSLLVIQNPQGSRLFFRDLAVSIVDLVRKANVPTLWALDSNASDDATSNFDSAEGVLGYLIKQAMELFLPHQTEAGAASLRAQFSRANKVQDLAQLLGACLRNLHAVYIVIDIEAQSLDGSDGTVLCLIHALESAFDKLLDNNSQARVKVVMTCQSIAGVRRESLSVLQSERVEEEGEAVLGEEDSGDPQWCWDKEIFSILQNHGRKMPRATKTTMIRQIEIIRHTSSKPFVSPRVDALVVESWGLSVLFAESLMAANLKTPLANLYTS